MKYSVDRIEDGIAVCEDEFGNFEKFTIADLPIDIAEGDMFSLCDGEFKSLEDETAIRKKKIAALQKSIFAKKK